MIEFDESSPMTAAGKNATTCSDVPDPKCEYAKVTLGYQADEAWVVIIAVLIWASMTYIMYLLAFRELVDDDDALTNHLGDKEDSVPSRRNTAPASLGGKKCHYRDNHGFVL
ncbi:MAG: hypothetical protein CMI26_10705 [Opitutae bacterium]|nr:hypothetical protein [Opitutae bacterium]